MKIWTHLRKSRRTEIVEGFQLSLVNILVLENKIINKKNRDVAASTNVELVDLVKISCTRGLFIVTTPIEGKSTP